MNIYEAASAAAGAGITTHVGKGRRSYLNISSYGPRRYWPASERVFFLCYQLFLVYYTATNVTELPIHCKKYTYTNEYLVASFPYFNGTGSVYASVCESTE